MLDDRAKSGEDERDRSIADLDQSFAPWDIWLLPVAAIPAIPIPIGQTPDGLPICLQIVGNRWQELELIAIAQQLDAIIGQCQPPPGYQ